MMNKKKQKISLLLSATLLLTSVPAMQYAISAETQAELQAENEDSNIISIPVDEQKPFDKVTLSYRDPASAELKISFSKNGTDFGEPKTVTFENQTDVSFELDEVLTAKAVKVEGAEDLGLPNLKLSKLTKYKATKDNVGVGTRGTAEKFDSMWSPGHNNFAGWFDGTYDEETGELTNVNIDKDTGLYHDALKKGYTENKDEAMIELTFNFDKPEDFAYAVLYMDKGNTADFQVRILDDEEEDNKEEDNKEENGKEEDNKEENNKAKYKILSELTKEKDFGDSVKIGNKEVYKITAPINTITDSFNIYWYNFHNYAMDAGAGKENARVDIPEMAFYYYAPVYESGFVCHDGAEYALDEPKTFARIVGNLPEDMWYVGITADGTEVKFEQKEGSVGYLADEIYEITKIKIQGYNMQNVKSARFPVSVEIYGEVSDLAKEAYNKNNNSVTFDKATDADFGADTRKAYMDITKETGVAALFDGDTQYNSYTPYHTFVDADPARLTIKGDGSITVDLGAKSIIDSISYYAGPQYTPKKYTVLVSDNDTFSNASTALEKEYKLLEGRLSPFTTPDQFYCSMREDHALKYTSGRYVKIVNDGVLKPEDPHLVIENEKGEVAIDTMMNNDAMMNKGVILVKELKIMGAPLLGTIEPNTGISCKYNDDDTVIAGDNKVTVNINNTTLAGMNNITVYAAVYNTDGTLKSVKLKNTSIDLNGSQEVEIDGLTAEEGETIGVFVWDNKMTPMALIPKKTVNQ